MGSESSYAYEVTKAPSFAKDIKVHSLMCTELINLLDGVSTMLQKIEVAQPRGSGAISSLCLLNNAICKAKLLIQHCKESSKLYLTLNGEAIATRCGKIKHQVEQSLGQLQNMVPVILGAEISQTISKLRGVVLRSDTAEQDAGKVLRGLVQLHSSSTKLSAHNAEAFQVAMSRLHISSGNDISIEKKSIKKQIDEVAENNPMKKKILSLFLCLLDKYGGEE